MNPAPLYLLFQKNPTVLYGRAICWWTSGPYFHSALMFANGEAFEADYGGVRCVNKPKLDPAFWDLYGLDLKPEVVHEIRDFLVRQLGDPYDWYSLIWSQILMHPRSHPDAWYCSELCAAALELGYRFPDDPCTYSPNSLYRYFRTSGFIDTVSGPLSY